MLTKGEIYFVRTVFKNRILMYKGQIFEDFFVSIMTKANADFQPVKAHGSIGDKKNDGYVSDTVLSSLCTGRHWQRKDSL